MVGRVIIAAIFALLLTAAPSWAQSIGGYGGIPPSLVLPGQPTNVTATASNGRAVVSFLPPKYTGKIPIIRYTVTSRPGPITATAKQSPITVPGLTNGVTYTFTVTATNSVGTGPASRTSNKVTPKAK